MKTKIIELIKYGFWGGITTLINLALFALFDSFDVMHYVVANGIAYVIAVVINYVFNKLFVFTAPEQKATDRRETVLQFLKFVLLRAISLLVDSVLFFILVELFENLIAIKLGFITTRLIIRVLLSMAIIMATFVFSKLFIFKAKSKNVEEK